MRPPTTGTANVENLVLQGSADLQGYGNAGERDLRQRRQQHPRRRAGADPMDGGAGNDAYFVDNTGEWIREPQRGHRHGLCDRPLRLGANVENLVLQGSADCRVRQRSRTRSTAPVRTTCSTAMPAPTRCMAGRQRRLFPRQHRRRGGRERQRGQRHRLCDRQLGLAANWRPWCCRAAPTCKATATP